MPNPTPFQQAILDLLTECEYQTTAQIWAEVPTDTKERGRRALLARMEGCGWIRAVPLYPERGRASERCWTLTPAGAAACSTIYVPPQAQHLGDIHRYLDLPAKTIGIGPNTARVLTLLAVWKQLTTSQIWRTLDPDKELGYTRQMLLRLQTQGLVRGGDLHPRLGATSEHYWMLLERGAQAVGRPYGKQHRRRPTVGVIEYRGMVLDLLSVISDAGWKVYQSEDDFALKEQQLIKAVLAAEQKRVEELLANGHPQHQLQEAIARLERGHVGAVVLARVPDYVAYVPNQPRQTTVFIPHPPYATRALWRHRRALPDQPGRRPRRPSRLELYARLAAVLPVVAVFADGRTAGQYVPLLAPTKVQWLAIAEVPQWLRIR